MEQETNRFGGGGGWGKTMRMRPPRPVWGRWRSGTPVDRFHGFLGLPVEFEVEMPPRVLSARLEAPKQEEVVIQKVNLQVATKKERQRNNGKMRMTVLTKATFEDSMKDEAIARNHSTTKEAIAVGTSAGAYRIILTHFTNPGTNPCLAIPLKDVCSTFLNVYGQDLDNDQRYIRTLHPREEKQQKVSRSLRLQTSQVFVTPLLGLGCCRSFRNTTDVRLDCVVVGEAEQPARELLDAGDGWWRSLPRTVGGGARLCSLEAPPPLLLELSRTTGGDVGSPSTEDLAGDGRRGSLPAGEHAYAPGKPRLLCSWSGRGRPEGVRAH